MPKIICTNCSNYFDRIKSHIEYNSRRWQGGKNFCSLLCRRKYENTSISFNCYTCQVPIARDRGEIKKNKSGKFYCSKKCAAKENNKHRTKCRRSKIEKKFFELLCNEFPSLKFISNDRTLLNGLEIDIAVPELKLGIEWNGIVHFKPIYGEEKLLSVQQKDQEKLLIANQKNIRLIVISDIFSNKKILNQSFDEVKQIILSLIPLRTK